MHTKYVDSKLRIEWREKSINKVNEPPGDIEGYCYRKQDNTAKYIKISNLGQKLMSVPLNAVEVSKSYRSIPFKQMENNTQMPF